ncbi:MAG TPA: hypothetical protein PK280_11625 [Planctomycetota bacterium]|nr:hypothetical protein [Planctomycetota bacterium]
MMRIAVLAPALVCILSWGALADDSVNWTTTAGAATVKKALDIITHGAEVRAITHDNKIYKGVFNPASKTVEWSLDFTIAAGSSSNPGNNNCSWRLYDKVKLWPQMVSFGGSLYICRYYMTVREGPGGSCTNYMYPELRVIRWDGAAESTVLQIGGAPSTAWQCGAVFNFYNPISDTMVPGNLFVSGGTLYWGGGGGKRIDPVTLPSGDAALIDWNKYGSDFRYVYSTPDGTNWTLVNRSAGNDDYGRAMPAAVPSGYRNSHLVEFPAGSGTFYDYYGSYAAGTLAFTAYAAGTPHTEPWGWFLMGKDTARMYRVAHNMKGDNNFVYASNGGAWSTNWGAGSDAGPNGAKAGNTNVYWRGCAAISDNTNTIHNGLYCTYSQYNGGSNYESGVYRYFPDTAGGTRTAGWYKCISTADARVYTGGIFVNKDDGVYVGTSNGILRRAINDVDQPTPATPKAADPAL